MRSSGGLEWSSFMQCAKGGWKSNVNGRQESVNAPRENSVPHENCPTQAKTGLEQANSLRD
jgi:hypothetical protein